MRAAAVDSASVCSMAKTIRIHMQEVLTSSPRHGPQVAAAWSVSPRCSGAWPRPLGSLGYGGFNGGTPNS